MMSVIVILTSYICVRTSFVSIQESFETLETLAWGFPRTSSYGMKNGLQN